MTKRVINLLFFIVLNIFDASLSGIIPLFSRSANAEAELSVISVSYSSYHGLVVVTNDESRNFKIDETLIALFDGDEKIGLSAGECTSLAGGKVCIPPDSLFPAADNRNLKVIFGKGFAVSENGARLAEEEIWVYESFDDEYSAVWFRKISPADEPDESNDESNPEESISESESSSERESESFSDTESESEESDSAEESVSESESESMPESESSSENESPDESESDSENTSESEEVSDSESIEESESEGGESLSDGESITASEGKNSGDFDSESDPNENDSEKESPSDGESITASEGKNSGDFDSESETKDESKADEESNLPTSENRERGCKSNIYSCLTTVSLAVLIASAFTFFNSKKK